MGVTQGSHSSAVGASEAGERASGAARGDATCAQVEFGRRGGGSGRERGGEGRQRPHGALGRLQPALSPSQALPHRGASEQQVLTARRAAVRGPGALQGRGGSQQRCHGHEEFGAGRGEWWRGSVGLCWVQWGLWRLQSPVAARCVAVMVLMKTAKSERAVEGRESAAAAAPTFRQQDGRCMIISMSMWEIPET